MIIKHTVWKDGGWQKIETEATKIVGQRTTTPLGYHEIYLIANTSEGPQHLSNFHSLEILPSPQLILEKVDTPYYAYIEMDNNSIQKL